MDAQYFPAGHKYRYGIYCNVRQIAVICCQCNVRQIAVSCCQCNVRQIAVICCQCNVRQIAVSCCQCLKLFVDILIPSVKVT